MVFFVQNFHRLSRDRKGAIAVLAGLLALPLALAVGASIGYAQLASGDTWLQDAVDNSALAGAAVYTDSTQSSAAQALAVNYMGKMPTPAGITIVSTTVTAVQDSSSLGYNVTVTATAKLTSPVMPSLLASPSFTETAIARNPTVLLNVLTNHFATSASDWNSIYYYPVPMLNGQPQYNTVPDLSQFYEVASNCNATYNSGWTSKSRCNNSSGAIPNNATKPIITSTQPISFVLENMTAGLISSTSTNSTYTSNSYGSKAGNINYFSSAFEAAAGPPSQSTNYYNSVLNNTTTYYPTASSSSILNCSLLIQIVNPSNLPSTAPTTGSCFATNSTVTGYQYTALTCASMAGKTYMFWWNDMGGSKDDHDYNDASYTFSCSVVGGSTGNTQVVLIK